MMLNRLIKGLLLSSVLVLSACGGSSGSSFSADSGSDTGGGNTTNNAPVASDGSQTTDENISVDITLTATDSDNDSLTYSIVTNPTNGTVTLSGAVATYTPTADYDGSDSFTFKANDGTDDSNTATVSLTVNNVNVSVNAAPVAEDSNQSTDENTPVDITLVATDSDNDSLSYSIVTNPTNGTVTLSAAVATYTPNADYNGSDSFTFKANDGTDDSNTATVSITINNVITSDCAVVTPTYSYTVVDTNQTLCYDESTGDAETCAGEGQDGDYTINPPNYTSCDSDEIVVDNNTGLMWLSSTDTDGVDGLTTDDKLNRDDAETYCDDLIVSTYTDWRLPSTKELVSIYLMSGEDLSAIDGASTNGYYVDPTGYEPFLDTNYFDIGYGDTDERERIIDGQYATSTLNVSPVMSGITYSEMDGFFGVNFVDGHIKTYEADISEIGYYARCVRGNTDYGVNNFTDNSNNTISDSATGLMWQKDDSGSPAPNFSDALASCEAATTGGKNDWRLPSMKELHSILDLTRSPESTNSPAIDTDYFNTTQVTNEAGETDWPAFWSSTALLNYLGSGNKGAYITFGRGLGYFSTDDIGFVDVHGAGAQRSDGKTDSILSNPNVETHTPDAASSFGSTAYTSGPQGDLLRPEYNYVRCVRTE